MTWPHEGGGESRQGEGHWGQQPPAAPQSTNYPGEQYFAPATHIAPQPPQPGGNRNLIILTAVAVVGLAAVIAVGVLLSMKSSHSTTTAAGPSPSATDSATASASPSPSAAGTGGGAVSPTVPGWQGVQAGSADVDVPSDWTVGSSASLSKVGGVAISGVGACGSQGGGGYRAVVATVTDPGADPTAVANSQVQQFLAGAGMTTANPQVSMAPPVAGTGGYQDYKATITLTPAAGDNCTPPEAIVHIVLTSGSAGTTGVLIEGDQQVNEAVAESDLDKIATTVRPAS